MNKFDSLDSFSYQCGVIDAFNEASGVLKSM